MYYISCEDLIWDIIAHSPPNKVFALNDFKSCGSNDAIRKALSRASLTKKLLRIVDGVYTLPSNPSPSPGEVASALTRNHYWTVLPCTEYARFYLKLSDVYPSDDCFYSTGPTETYSYGPPTDRKHLKLIRITKRFVHELSFGAAVVVIALMDLDEHKITAEEVYSLSKSLTKDVKDELISRLHLIPARLRPVIEIICDRYGRSSR